MNDARGPDRAQAFGPGKTTGQLHKYGILHTLYAQIAGLPKLFATRFFPIDAASGILLRKTYCTSVPDASRKSASRAGARSGCERAARGMLETRCASEPESR